MTPTRPRPTLHYAPSLQLPLPFNKLDKYEKDDPTPSNLAGAARRQVDVRDLDNGMPAYRTLQRPSRKQLGLAVIAVTHQVVCWKH